MGCLLCSGEGCWRHWQRCCRIEIRAPALPASRDAGCHPRRYRKMTMASDDGFHVDDRDWFARHAHSQHRVFSTDQGFLFLARVEDRDGPATPPFDTEEDEIAAMWR